MRGAGIPSISSGSGSDSASAWTILLWRWGSPLIMLTPRGSAFPQCVLHLTPWLLHWLGWPGTESPFLHLRIMLFRAALWSYSEIRAVTSPTAWLPFLYSVTFSSPPTVSGSRTMRLACVREMDGICSVCISTLAPGAPAEPYLGDAGFCAIELERRPAPFQAMSYFLPIQNTLMGIMTHIRYCDG